jgi:isoleucyl-tRNA synthetase
LPFLSEEIFRGLTGERSVHLADWPDPETLPADPKLVAEMDRVRDACSAARTLRERENVRVRQPLAALTLAGRGVADLAPYAELLRDEVNVKELRIADAIEDWASFQLRVDSRALGPRLGSAMKTVLAAAKQGAWHRRSDGSIDIAGQRLAPSEVQLRLVPHEGVVCEPLATHDAIAVLDLELTDALVQEGVARDVVRGIQQARKEAGLHVSDTIRVALVAPDEWRMAIERHHGWIAGQTLARSITLVPTLDDEAPSRSTSEFGEHRLEIGVIRSA